MKEWIEFLVSYPTWVKVFVAVSIGINLILLTVFRADTKKKATIKFTAIIVDATASLKRIAGAKVSLDLNYQGISKVCFADAEGVCVYALEGVDLPLNALLRADGTGFISAQRYIQIESANQSETIQLQPAPLPPGSSVTPPRPTPSSDDEESKTAIRNIVTGCNRRSVYTKMHAQISLEAMYQSLSQCRNVVQNNQPLIKPKRLSQIAANLITSLDAIERQKGLTSSEAFEQINQLKLSIIRGLNDLSKSIKLTLSLPPNLVEDYFFTLEDANRLPNSPH